MIKPEELEDGFSNEGDTNREEAIERYGEEQIRKSEAFLNTLEKFEFEQLKREQKENFEKLYSLRNEDPTSYTVQYEIAHHYQLTRQVWGTANSKDKQAEAYKGLGQLYVNDERITLVEGQTNPEFALFLYKAIECFALNQLN